jgi:hypothetical protein
MTSKMKMKMRLSEIEKINYSINFFDSYKTTRANLDAELENGYAQIYSKFVQLCKNHFQQSKAHTNDENVNESNKLEHKNELRELQNYETLFKNVREPIYSSKESILSTNLGKDDLLRLDNIQTAQNNKKRNLQEADISEK